ncbi:MAG TPA: hypothetical protein VF974_01680 [Patescibacteria group bacterium]
MKNKPTTFDVRPYNIKELCAIYGVTYRTMIGWLEAHREAIGEKVGRYYTALQVKIIFEKLGLPSQIDEDD